jgi:hypothetical protein
MTQRHVHADLIIAWANGAKIQCKSREFTEWVDIDLPRWFTHYEYRVKPEPKPDLEFFGQVEWNFCYSGVEAPSFGPLKHSQDNVKLTFDGETHKLKSVEIVK